MGAGMAKLKLPPNVHRQVRPSGRIRYTYQVGRGTKLAGPRIRLPDDPHTPEFWAALSKLRTQEAAPTEVARKTISGMVDAYFASPHLASLSQSTKREYLRYLREFQAELGKLHPDELKPFNLARLRDNLADTPAKANSTIKAIGALYKWGREQGWAMNDNPAGKITMLEVGEHQPWPQEALDAFPTALPPAVARACMIGLHTGQRLGDVLRMHRDHVEGNAIWVTQGKTGKQLLIPLHSAIKDLVLGSTGLICPKNAKGEAWTVDQFKAQWGRSKRLPAAKVILESGVVFHGLRKNATVNLLEAGCSEAEVSSITGMSLQMVVHYGKGAKQRRLAVEAMKKLEALAA